MNKITGYLPSFKLIDKPFKFLVPEYFEPDKVKPIYKARVCHFVNSLVTKKVYDRRYKFNKGNYIDGDDVRMSSIALKECYGSRHYLNVVNEAVRLGVVKRLNYHPSEGRATRFYIIDYESGNRINPKTKTKQIEIIDRKLRRRLIQVNEKKRQWILNKGKIYQCLERDLSNLKIDKESAINKVREMNLMGELTNVQFDVYNWGIDVISDYSERELIYSVDDYGRVHSILTSFPRILRQFLSLGEEDLWSVDISNSQPFLAIPIFRSYMQQKGLGLTNDILEYEKYAIEGGFYETLMDDISFPIEMREEYKHNIFFKHIFYSTLASNERSKHWKSFSKRFPKCAEIIVYEKRNSHKEFARKMQRIESDLIINNVCRKLYRDYPCIRILTIHDSILTTEKYLDAVRGTIGEIFLSKYGIEKKIKKERVTTRNTIKELVA